MAKTLDQLLEEGRFTSKMKSALRNLFGYNTKTYKVYSALLTQNGTNAPTVTVLDNELEGTVVWTYDGIGIYRGTLIGKFTENKTSATIQQSAYGDNRQINAIDVESINYFIVYTFSATAPANGMLNKTSIEIKVYNPTSSEGVFSPPPPVLPEGGGDI